MTLRSWRWLGAVALLVQTAGPVEARERGRRGGARAREGAAPRTVLPRHRRFGEDAPVGPRGARVDLDPSEFPDVSLPPGADPEDPLLTLKLTARRATLAGQPQRVMGDLREALETHPDDVDLHALLGAALARAGHYPDAAAELALGRTSPYYELDGLDAEADVLRAEGRGRAAAELRFQRFLAEGGPGLTVFSLQGVIDDYRSAGDLEAAEDMAWKAIAWRPWSPSPYAMLALVKLDEGDLAEAEALVWLAERNGTRDPAPLDLARARILASYGAYDEAARALHHAARLRPRSRAILAARAALLREAGRPADALALIEMPRWGHHQDPFVWAVEVEVRWDLGEKDAARALLDRALRLYPDNPELARARAYLGD